MHWRPFLAHQRCIVPDWLGIVRYIYTRLSLTPRRKQTYATRRNKAIDEKKKIAPMLPRGGKKIPRAKANTYSPSIWQLDKWLFFRWRSVREDRSLSLSLSLTLACSLVLPIDCTGRFNFFLLIIHFLNFHSSSSEWGRGSKPVSYI